MSKLEPVNNDVNMPDIKDSAVPETPLVSTSPVTAKRPRGRPRKHLKVNPDSMVKFAKRRSKTGCITCRKRKKKCDEAKPTCKLDIYRMYSSICLMLIPCRYKLQKEFCRM